MYRALWDWLPGNQPLKIVQVVIVAIMVFFALMEVIFPAIGPLVPGSNVVMESGG